PRRPDDHGSGRSRVPPGSWRPPHRSGYPSCHWAAGAAYSSHRSRRLAGRDHPRECAGEAASRPVRPNKPPTRPLKEGAGPSSHTSRFAELPEEQIFGERHAFEFQKLGVLLHAAIERKTDFPGPCIDLEVLDRGLVQQMIGTRGSVALDDVQCVAMKIARPIEPGFFALAGHIDDQSVALPTTARPPHPRRRRRRLLPSHWNDAGGAGECIGDQDVWIRSLHDLKRKRHV